MKQWRSTICLIAAAMMLAAPPIPLRAAQAETEHQYARLREVKLELKDFSFPTPTGATLNLRDAARGKRLVIVSYFAAWCHNSNYDVTTLNELYLKYREQGLAVVGVCEYSSAEELRGFVDRHQPIYPICFESTDQIKDRSTTTHHRYRKQANDKRKWGTPFNLVISASEIEERGETVARRVRVAAGELIKAEVEELIRQQLSASGGNEKPLTIK
jgi:peroxiredoxin